MCSQNFNELFLLDDKQEQFNHLFSKTVQTKCTITKMGLRQAAWIALGSVRIDDGNGNEDVTRKHKFTLFVTKNWELFQAAQKKMKTNCLST